MKREPTPPPIDWVRIIEQLQAKKPGMTLAEIGSALDWTLTPKMVSHLRLGGQLLPHRGRALLDLWAEKMKRKADTAPRVGESPIPSKVKAARA